MLFLWVLVVNDSRQVQDLNKKNMSQGNTNTVNPNKNNMNRNKPKTASILSDFKISNSYKTMQDFLQTS